MYIYIIAPFVVRESTYIRLIDGWIATPTRLVNASCHGTWNYITVTDKKFISNISDYLSKLKFKRISNKPLIVGWSYMFSFYENDTNTFGFASLGDPVCLIKGNRYSVLNSTNITIESLYNEAKKVSGDGL